MLLFRIICLKVLACRDLILFCFRESSVVVQRKIRGQRRKQKRKKRARNDVISVLSEEEKAAKWGEILSSVRDQLEVQKLPRFCRLGKSCYV